MNILILNWRDLSHPLAGGAEISLFEHAKYWQKQGAAITWFSSGYIGGKEREVIDGITYIRKGSHYTVHIWFFLCYLRDQFASVDVLVDCFHFLPFFTPLYVKKKKIIPLINEVAGKVWYANLPFLFAWIGFHIEPFFFMPYRKLPFITASDSAKKDLISVGIPEKNISIIHHGVTIINPGTKIIKEKYPTLLFLNRISKDKGIADALKAFKSLSQHYSDITFWIVGKEETAGELERVLEAVGLKKEERKKIVYHGFVSQKEKFELMKRAWMLIHPSKKEGWGLTVIEAASQATPTVGYDVEGLRDSIQNEKTGLLVKPEPQNLADGINKLLAERELLEKLSLHAVRWAEEFDWDESGKQSWKVIKTTYEK